MSGLLLVLKALGILILILVSMFVLMLIVACMIILAEETIRIIKEKGGKK